MLIDQESDEVFLSVCHISPPINIAMLGGVSELSYFPALSPHALKQRHTLDPKSRGYSLLLFSQWLKRAGTVL